MIHRSHAMTARAIRLAGLLFAASVRASCGRGSSEFYQVWDGQYQSDVNEPPSVVNTAFRLSESDATAFQRSDAGEWVNACTQP